MTSSMMSITRGLAAQRQPLGRSLNRASPAVPRCTVHRALAESPADTATLDQFVLDELAELKGVSEVVIEAEPAKVVLPTAEVVNEVAEALPEVGELSVGQRLWKGYMDSLETSPLLTKCLTSLVGFSLGDCVAQVVAGDGHFHAVRLLHLAVYGFVVDAPAGNAFYNYLDATISPEDPKSTKSVLTKIAIDQLVYAPAFTCILYAYLKTVELQPELIIPTIQAKLLPTLLANYAIWPLAHGLNFKFVPTEQRILYNNFVAVIWTTYLSVISH